MVSMFYQILSVTCLYFAMSVSSLDSTTLRRIAHCVAAPEQHVPGHSLPWIPSTGATC